MGFLKRLFGRKDEELPDPSLYITPRRTEPSRAEPFRPGSFRMPIEDIFVISDRGIVLTGRVKAGTLQTGDAIEIRNDNVQVYTRAISIESFRKKVDVAKEGDHIGIMLPQDVPRSVLKKGMVVINQEQE
jgi:translation elongation factor EF-Tu-like GTPase